MTRWVLLMAVGLTACPPLPAVEAGVPDSGDDAGRPDAGTGDGGADAGLDAGLIDAGPVCPAQCEYCMDGTCYVACRPGGDGGCACPPGMPCSVFSQIPAAVDCTLATSCNIQCDTAGACAGGVRCGAGDCTILCGAGNCNGPIDCSASFRCDLRCGQDGCENEIHCGGAACTIDCSAPNSCTFTNKPIDCTAGSCAIDCRAGCFGREVRCGGGSCDVRSPICNAAMTCPSLVDCSQSCGCNVQPLASSSPPVTCPAFCDGGCVGDAGCNGC